MVTNTGGAEVDVKIRIQKTSEFFIQICQIWKDVELFNVANLRVFISNIKSVLLYGWEAWKVTEGIMKDL
jgi:hypothetical protein